MKRVKIYLKRFSNSYSISSDKSLATTVPLDVNQDNQLSPDKQAGHHTSTQGSSNSQDERTGSDSISDTTIAAQGRKTPHSNAEAPTCDSTAPVTTSSPTICPTCAVSLPGPLSSFDAVDECLEVSLDGLPTTPNLPNSQASTPLVSVSPSVGLPLPTTSLRRGTALQVPLPPVSVEPAQHLVPPVITLVPPAPSVLPVPTSLGPQKEDPFGIKALAEGADAKVDLVAVHGLDGHWEDSWTAGNGTLWLRDLLPGAVADLRILTWGYDGRTQGNTPLSCQSLHDHALALITDLTSYRRKTITQERPIIFIAHGVGGIIIKDALIHSNSANRTNLEHHHAIKISTYGVLFFGTPHQGTENASWSQLLFSTTSLMTRKNKALLRDLEEHSASLQKQLAQYNHISDDFETKFFYETYAPAGDHVVVPVGAAVVPGATNAETFSINSDHTGLIKYRAATDAGFKKVSLCISLMVDEAPMKAADRWERQRLISAAEKNEGVVLSFEIPFELEHLRNHRFTGRPSLLASIQDVVKANSENDQSTPIVLYGTGGIGKSQVVVEYLYAHQKDHPSIFWINSATPGMIALGFRIAAQRLIKQHAKLSLKSSPHYPTIAKNLGMAGAVDERGLLFPEAMHNECIINAVKLWLSNEENQNWLLVFDNVDDLDNLNIEAYMPSPATGTIIMTSRRPECAHFGVGLEVGLMLESEAVTLLLKTAGLSINVESLEDGPSALDLAKALGFLPLALVQAGAYIAAHKTPVKEYHRIYQESFERALAKKLPSGSWTYKDRSILTTWEISFQAVRQVNNGAAELLSLCAFIFNEIDLGMLHRGGIVEASDKCLDLLYSYSLAHPQRTNSSFYIHPVVHRWAQERLDISQRVVKARKAMDLVGSGVQRGAGKTIEHWQYEMKILMHIDSVTQNAQVYLSTEILLQSDITVLTALYKVNLDWGRLTGAEWIASKLYEFAQSHGSDELSTTGMAILAATYSKQGRNDEAEGMFLQVLEAEKTTLGPEQPDTLPTMNNLAITYCMQGRLDEAERLQLQVLETAKGTLGPEHPDTLSAMNNLATIYSKKCRSDETERLQLQVLEARKRTLGPEHPDTLSAMHGLADTYCMQDRLDEAGRLQLQVVEARKRTLGPEHPDTLSAMSNLATIYSKKGPSDEAERLQLQVLEARKRTLGSEHPGTLSVMHGLANTYCLQGQSDEAERLQLQVLEVRKRTLGTEHPDTLSAMHGLATTYCMQGRLDEAERLQLQVLEARKRTVGPAHPDTLSAMHNLTKTYTEQGRWGEVERLQLQVIEARKKTLGPEHPGTLSAMNILASIYRNQHRWDEAEKLQRQALDETKYLSLGHPIKLQLMKGLADILLLQCKFSEGYEIISMAVVEIECIHGKDYPGTIEYKSLAELFSRCLELLSNGISEAKVRQLMGGNRKEGMGPVKGMTEVEELHTHQGQNKNAERLLEEVMKRKEVSLGVEHPDTLSAIASLASYYCGQKKWNQAENLQQLVVDTRQRVLGDEHTDTLSAMVCLASIHWNQGEWEKAEVLEKQVVDGRKRVLGTEHPDTISAMASLAVSYRMQGQYKEAGELHQRVVDATKRLRGSEHPQTMTAMSNLASAYGSQERWEEAEELQETIMDTRQRQFGKNHPDTQRAMRNLAFTYRQRGRHEEASNLHLQLLNLSQPTSSYDHPSTIDEMGDLVNNYISQGRIDDLPALLIETSERLGEENKITLTLKAIISAIYRSSGRYDEASILREQVIEAFQRSGANPELLLRFAGNLQNA